MKEGREWKWEVVREKNLRPSQCETVKCKTLWGVGAAVFCKYRYFCSGYFNPSLTWGVDKKNAQLAFCSIFPPEWKQQLSQKSPCLRLTLLWNITQLPQRKMNWFESSPSKAINNRADQWIHWKKEPGIGDLALKMRLSSIIHHSPNQTQCSLWPILFYIIAPASYWKQKDEK